MSAWEGRALHGVFKATITNVTITTVRCHTRMTSYAILADIRRVCIRFSLRVCQMQQKNKKSVGLLRQLRVPVLCNVLHVFDILCNRVPLLA